MPIISQLILIAVGIFFYNSPEEFSRMPVPVIIYLAILFGWIYSLGTNLYKKRPDRVHMNVTLFKVLFSISTIYILSINMLRMSSVLILNLLVSVSNFVMAFYLFSISCIIYGLYFTAKTLRSIELQREATFKECIGTVILCIPPILFIGIWIIQPKINKLFENNPNS